MKNPLVACIMLTLPGREPFAARATRCFDRQTYPNRRIVVVRGKPGQTIGALRNHGAEMAHEADIICTWDDDDWSHPLRLEEQVRLLQESGADVVGYSDLLFWRTAECEAWLYRKSQTNYAPGTSQCYWRRTWERRTFPASSNAEDYAFCYGRTVLACPSIVDTQPRMIATIHGGNTMATHYRACLTGSRQWQRVEQWDQYCYDSLSDTIPTEVTYARAQR